MKYLLKSVSNIRKLIKSKEKQLEVIFPVKKKGKLIIDVAFNSSTLYATVYAEG